VTTREHATPEYMHSLCLRCAAIHVQLHGEIRTFLVDFLVSHDSFMLGILNL
jgi:hypothetical protein